MCALSGDKGEPGDSIEREGAKPHWTEHLGSAVQSETPPSAAALDSSESAEEFEARWWPVGTLETD